MGSESIYVRVDYRGGLPADVTDSERMAIEAVSGTDELGRIARARGASLEVEALRTQLAEEVRLRKLRKALHETVIEAESAIKAEALRDLATWFESQEPGCTDADPATQFPEWTTQSVVIRLRERANRIEETGEPMQITTDPEGRFKFEETITIKITGASEDTVEIEVQDNNGNAETLSIDVNLGGNGTATIDAPAGATHISIAADGAEPVTLVLDS